MTYNVITAIIAVIGLLMVARGFIPLLWMRFAPWVTWVTAGVVALAITIAARLFYWDLLRGIMGSNWIDLRDRLGGQEFSAVFNTGVIFACFLLLRSRLLLIPEDERDNWRWWNAWLHPEKHSLLRLYNNWRNER